MSPGQAILLKSRFFAISSGFPRCRSGWQNFFTFTGEIAYPAPEKGYGKRKSLDIHHYSLGFLHGCVNLAEDLPRL